LQIVPAGEIFAGRFLYVPLLLASPAMGWAIQTLWACATSHAARSVTASLATLVLILAVGQSWSAAAIYGSSRAYEEAVLARFPHDAAAWNGLGLAREREGDPAGARAAWLAAIKADETYGRPHSNLGRLDLAAGATDSARAHFESAAQLGPGNPVAWINLGSVKLRGGEFEGAISAYRRATQLAPGMSVAWAGLGRAHLKSGNREQAQAALEEALRIDPSNKSARQSLGEVRDSAPE
jgi:tetratricopeptide (TPR) repeat protein